MTLGTIRAWRSMMQLIGRDRATSYRRQGIVGAQQRRAMDQLIRDVAHRRQAFTLQHAAQLREDVATAPFSTQQVRVTADLRGVTYQGRTLLARDDSGFVHLVKRVLVNQEWIQGTALGEYLDDLHAVARNADSEMAIYDVGRGPVAVAIGPNIVPASRLGPGAEAYLVVVYSPDRNGIISGYQVSDLSEVNIPKDVQWLT